MPWKFLINIFPLLAKGGKACLIPAACICLFGGGYYLGYTSGQAEIRLEWQKEREDDAVRLSNLKQSYEDRYQQLVDKLYLDRIEYEKKLSAVDSAYVGRVHESESRALQYKRQAESGRAESLKLAEYAARLDRQLVEGIRVVEDLKGTLESRDLQVRELIKQVEEEHGFIRSTR